MEPIKLHRLWKPSKIKSRRFLTLYHQHETHMFLVVTGDAFECFNPLYSLSRLLIFKQYQFVQSIRTTVNGKPFLSTIRNTWLKSFIIKRNDGGISAGAPAATETEYWKEWTYFWKNRKTYRLLHTPNSADSERTQPPFDIYVAVDSTQMVQEHRS